jgi:hypothetical protein
MAAGLTAHCAGDPNAHSDLQFLIAALELIDVLAAGLRPAHDRPLAQPRRDPELPKAFGGGLGRAR